MKHIRNCRGRMDQVGVALVQCWRCEGVPFREIARRLHCSHKTVRNAVARAQSGRRKRTPPLLTTARRKQIVRRRKHVKRLALKQTMLSHCSQEFPSCAAIAREAKVRSLFSASVATVRRDLHFLGFAARKRQRGPTRHPGDKEKRVQFCKQHCEPSDNILFSDEKLFDTNDHGCLWHWCLNGDMPQRRTEARWSPKVHVWGLIGVGLRELVVLPEGAIDQHKYKLHCLQRVLVPTVTRFGRRHIFMQDGARPHTAHGTLRYLDSKGVRVMPNWPPRSPDLNPIEHLWARMQRDVSDHGPSNTEDLTRFVVQCWGAIQQCEIDVLVRSFAQRCRNCVLGGGV